MKVITHPTVTVVAKQVFLEHPEFPIPDDGSDAVKIGAFAAKGCYDSFSKTGRSNESNQLAILEHRHGSVLEHITFTLFITGISRALSLESNRHRQLAVSQRSTRYTAEEDAAIVLEPFYAEIWNKYGFEEYSDDNDVQLEMGVYPSDEQYDSHPEVLLLRDFLGSCLSSMFDYQEQVKTLEELNPLGLTGFDLRKWARGKARNVLPHALETRITYTGNVRAWRWFLESRSDRHAEPEIRRLAHHVYQVLVAEAPIYFADFINVGDYDGIPEYKPTYSKV